MRFPPNFLDEIRTRLPVSEVVGRRVKLKKAGREWKGLSPFHQEKTPSFFVNDQKGFYHDFSSGKHGDIFGFVMDSEGVSFPEAVERLAGLAGLPMPKVSAHDDALEQRRKTLHEVAELAAKFFETTLSARAGAKARGYLADRGIAPGTQLKFRIGYAPPDRFALKEYLGAQGVGVPDMIEVGLLVAGDDIPVPYDRFRDRVMFPIADWRGRIIAFGGRALEKDVPAKYLNSPETPLFHKGSNLYNGAVARQATHKGATLVVVEGYVDVIAMVVAGYEGAVAPLGTALTEEQLGLLWKMGDEPILCFDGDGAGRRAAYRAVDLALPRLAPGKSLRIALLPEGQDPDDLARSGGREAIDEVLAAARPLSEMLWLRETESGGFDTPERRAALEARVGELTGLIANESVRRHYRADMDGRLRQLFAPAANNVVGFGQGAGSRRSDRGGRGQEGRGQGGRGQGFRGQNVQGPYGRWQDRGARPFAPLSPRMPTSSLVRGPKSGLPPREALIILAVVNHPWLLEAHAEEFSELEFMHADADLLRRAILDAALGHHLTEPEGLREALVRQNLAPVLARLESAITHRSDWPSRDGAASADVAHWWVHVVTLHRKKRTLNKELKDAERALGEEPTDANLAWLKDVQSRLAALEGSEAQIEGFGVSSGRALRPL